jgi:hypothetical protein
MIKELEHDKIYLKKQIKELEESKDSKKPLNLLVSDDGEDSSWKSQVVVQEFNLKIKSEKDQLVKIKNT